MSVNRFDWYSNWDDLRQAADAEFAQYMRGHCRRVWITVIVCSAAALLGLFLASQVKAETVDGHRIVIIDGDTIDVQGERIRILNIDAP